jgi:hypothetical protein
MPDGRFARPTVHKLELFLKNTLPLRAPAWDVVPLPQDSPASSARQPPDYHTRDFNPERLQGREVTIFGAGSVGSYLAYFLAIARLILHVIDCKKVEYKHVRDGRTIYDSSSIGLFKVEALKRKVEADRLGASIRTYPFNVAELTMQELRVMFQRSLLVVVAIDDPEQLLRVSDLAYPIVELIQVAMHRQALSGHVALSIPFATPCLRCTLGIDNSQDIHRLDGEPGNSLDIVNVAQHAARIAIDIMYSKVTGQSITRWDPSKNLIYIANTQQELSPDGPGLHYENTLRRPECLICNCCR